MVLGSKGTYYLHIMRVFTWKCQWKMQWICFMPPFQWQAAKGSFQKIKLHRNFLHTSKPSYSVLHENAAQTMTDVFVDASATNWTSGAFYQAHSIVLKAEPLLIEYGWYFMLHHYLFQDAIETSISTFNGHFNAVWGLKMDSKMCLFPLQVAFTAESQNNILIEGVTPGSAPWHTWFNRDGWVEMLEILVHKYKGMTKDWKRLEKSSNLKSVFPSPLIQQPRHITFTAGQLMRPTPQDQNKQRWPFFDAKLENFSAAYHDVNTWCAFTWMHFLCSHLSIMKMCKNW